ncbi:MarR family winged helix-turn-helix transcriptional regulator [Oleisolibacter albus]|uniref:MarR family winged helix-turn-helix transcriptional regulator n=1 Tax=Oleisolibacter albus TaxID=2171757 RepID=UPI000DF40224|nr:MarR family winged helix-turn-helix transcriptional regulator [Oleisolibacter albus]
MPDTAFRFRPEDAIALCLVDLANAISRHSEAMLEQAGLTAPQWTVLLNVAGDANFQDGTRMGGSIFSSEIAAARGLSRPHISATVTELIRKGLIRQDDDPQDRRRKLLSVSPQGLALLRRLQPQRQSLNDVILADLTAEEREQFLDVLLKLRIRARANEQAMPQQAPVREREGLRIAG